MRKKTKKKNLLKKYSSCPKGKTYIYLHCCVTVLWRWEEC